MSHDRMLDLDQQIRPRADTPVNRDFTPIAYYFSVALWSSRFDQQYRRLFEAAAHVSFTWMATFVAGLLLALAAALTATRTRGPGSGLWCKYRGHGAPVPGPRCLAREAARFCTAATGFSLIGLEMLLLLAFQAIYGYVYHQLAILIAAFMAGMALGSWWGLRDASDSVTDHLKRSLIPTLAGLQTIITVSPLALYGVLVLLTPIRSALGLWAVSQVAFPALAILCGVLGGYEFPIASRIFFTGAYERASGPGVLYGLDLIGACLAAVMLSAYIVPVFGFLKAAIFMGVVNLAPAGLAGLAAFEHRAPES